MRFTILLALFFVLGSLHAQQIDPSKAVCTVNGETITANEYYRTMEFLSGVGQRKGNQFIERPPAFMAMVQVITNKVILQLARSKGVEPTQAEINAELAVRKSEDPERYKKLSDLGMTDAEFKSQVAIDLAQFNLITLGVTVTDAQVSEHYGTNKLMYVEPAMVKLRVIVVNSEDKDKVDQALKTKKFADVAREMSTDVTKFAGGELPEVPVSNLPQNVLNEVSRTPAGSDTAWIESSGALAKYHIDSKSDAKQLPLDDKLKKQIKRQLMMDIGMNKNDIRAMLANSMRGLKVEIANAGLKKLWDLYVTEYLNSVGR